MKMHVTQGYRGTVVDLETGRRVPKVIWLDMDPVSGWGELEAYKTDGRGEFVTDINGDYITYRAKGRFQFCPVVKGGVPDTTGQTNGGGKSHAGVVMGAPACALCGSALTLRGDDLCAPCRAKDRGQRNRMKVERITSPLLDRRCQHKGCSRTATWSVSDEVEVTPQVIQATDTKVNGLLSLISSREPLRGRRLLFDRGATVGRHYYCSWHFKPPRILDSKGEVIEDIEEAHGVRPN